MLLHFEESLDLKQSKEGRLLTPSDQTLGTTIQSNNLLETEQTRAVEVCIFPATRCLVLIILNPQAIIREFDVTDALSAVVPTPASPKVSLSIPPDQLTQETHIKPSTVEGADAPVDALREDIYGSQASQCVEEVSKMQAESPEPPIQEGEDGETEVSSVSCIIKGPLNSRVMAETEQDASQIPVESDNQVWITSLTSILFLTSMHYPDAERRISWGSYNSYNDEYLRRSTWRSRFFFFIKHCQQPLDHQHYHRDWTRTA